MIDQKKTEQFILKSKPDLVILATKVGGILTNSSKKADFIYDNLMIQTNVIQSSFKAGVKKLIFLGSSCVYRNIQNNPSRKYLLSSDLEKTNDAYTIARLRA